MPQFLSPNAQELNSLIAPSKRINALNKRKYRGTETIIQQQGDVSAKFESVYDKLVDINASLGEIVNQMSLSGIRGAAPHRQKAFDNYINSIGNIERKAAGLLQYLMSQVPNLQIFSTAQIEQISSQNSSMVQLFTELMGRADTIQEPHRTAFKEILQTFSGDLMKIQTKLEGLQTPDGRGSLQTLGGNVERQQMRPTLIGSAFSPSEMPRRFL